ncbi:MAG: adenylyltransferase/cytidyltransferase family protein [Candidatus Liptonbacteria bacterium]|nr:adenylyltransferase/cytidyltransferase family protein [Candidatus Liptonbacteria bacterium]
MRKVLVFGVFDGLHEGHKQFLKQARAQGDYLVALVARDTVAEGLKGIYPRLPILVRMEHLKSSEYVDEVVMGDRLGENYVMFRKQRPAVVALGYDQQPLKEDLEKRQQGKEFDWEFEIKVMEPHEPEKFHSSIL